MYIGRGSKCLPGFVVGASIIIALSHSRSQHAEACANEAMRLCPVAPLLFFDAVQATRIRDVAIPSGTTLFCVMRKGAVDEAALGDAIAFRPERWLGGDESVSMRSPKRVSMPFGARPRLCPGRYLAMLEMNMVLGMLARNFDPSICSKSRRATTAPSRQ
jgi:cytochrome P450